MTSEKSATPPMFAAFRHRNFRLFWLGTVISHTGDWLDTIALNWLVMVQTGSAYDLGLINIVRALPMLIFTMVGGAVADAYPRNVVMILSQSVSMGLAVILAALVWAEITPIWALAALSIARGVAMSFSIPARHALIPLLVPREDLPNAVALNSASMNLTKILGPVTAGGVILVWGVTACFMLNALSFVAVLTTLAMLRITHSPRARAQGTGVMHGMIEGWRYMRGQQVVILLVMMAIVPTFLGQPYVHLLSIYAHSTGGWGPLGLGALTAAAGAGAVSGALLVAGARAMRPTGRVMLTALAAFGGMLMAFGANPVAVAAPVLLFLAGAFFVAYSSVHATLLQMVVPDVYRGRVLSTLFINRATVPLGTGLFAMLADVTSIKVSYFAMGLGIFLCALIAARSKVLRRLEVSV